MCDCYLSNQMPKTGQITENALFMSYHLYRYHTSDTLYHRISHCSFFLLPFLSHFVCDVAGSSPSLNLFKKFIIYFHSSLFSIVTIVLCLPLFYTVCPRSLDPFFIVSYYKMGQDFSDGQCQGHRRRLLLYVQEKMSMYIEQVAI